MTEMRHKQKLRDGSAQALIKTSTTSGDRCETRIQLSVQHKPLKKVGYGASDSERNITYTNQSTQKTETYAIST
jgi:hypothetical protein